MDKLVVIVGVFGAHLRGLKVKSTGKIKGTLELINIKNEVDLISNYRFMFIFHNLQIQTPVKYPSETYKN